MAELDDELRTKLEGAHARFAAMLPKVRAVTSALSARRWEDEVRALAAVVREVDQPDVELTRALARAEVEQWPRSEVTKVLYALRDARAALTGALRRRSNGTLTELLATLIGAPRAVARDARWAAAEEALSGADALVRALRELATVTERALAAPLSLADFSALEEKWSVTALQDAWQRVEAIDTTGGVARTLSSRRARPLAVGAAVSALLDAQFWRDALDGHLADVLRVRFAAVTITAAERLPVFRWALERAHDGAARLTPLSPRHALLMLANELSGQPESRPALHGGLAQVREWAQLADSHQDADWKALRAWLRSLKPVRALPAPSRGAELLSDLL